MKARTVRILRSSLTVLAMLALYAVIPVPGHRAPMGLTVLLALAGLGGLSAHRYARWYRRRNRPNTLR